MVPIQMFSLVTFLTSSTTGLTVQKKPNDEFKIMLIDGKHHDTHEAKYIVRYFFIKSTILSWITWLIGHYEFKKLHYQNEAKCKTFIVKMSVICMRIINYFNIKGRGLKLRCPSPDYRRFVNMYEFHILKSFYNPKKYLITCVTWRKDFKTGFPLRMPSYNRTKTTSTNALIWISIHSAIVRW